jgi:hypothetical protein
MNQPCVLAEFSAVTGLATDLVARDLGAGAGAVVNDADHHFL